MLAILLLIVPRVAPRRVLPRDWLCLVEANGEIFTGRRVLETTAAFRLCTFRD
jgi:hypothetical protein